MSTKAIAIVLLFASQVCAGIASNANFIVLVPRQYGDQGATVIMEYAQKYRDEIALEWFGEKLTDGEGQTSISLHIEAGRSSGLTWAKDTPERKLHSVFMTIDDKGKSEVSRILKHEICHTVLATKFPHPNRLPTWLEEGIASRYDSESLKEYRAEVRRRWKRPPRLALLPGNRFRSHNDDAYAAAESVVEFLIQRRGKTKLLESVPDVATLQVEWEAWLLRTTE